MSRTTPNRPRASYPDPGFRRLALAPGLLAAVILLAGILLLDNEFYIAVQLVASILALIMIFFVVQGRAWWWIPFLAAIAVLWNPIVPIILPDGWQLAAHYIAIPFVVLAGIYTKVPVKDEESSARRR